MSNIDEKWLWGIHTYNDIANEHLLITIREKHGPDS